MIARKLIIGLGLVFSLAWAGSPLLAPAQTGQSETGPWTNTGKLGVAEPAATIFQQVQPPTIHYASVARAEADRLLQADAGYQTLIREKLEGRWSSALVSVEGPEPFAITARFETWRGLVEFLGERSALVEVWARGEAGSPARRIPATELADLKRQRHEPPTFITVTYRDPTTGTALTFNLEFGFEAAEFAWSANQAYQRHRTLLLSARQILGAHNAKGQPDAVAQWDALQIEVTEKKLAIVNMPVKPTSAQDLFVAFEFEVDDQNSFLKVANIYRDSEVQKRIIDSTLGVVLQKAGETNVQQVLGFRQQALTDQLEPAPNSILGQDVVELRVKDSAHSNPKQWHVIEFGEPEMLKESALASFAELNAYLERHRKARAMTQANLALIAEPIIAGLNIGGGVAGLGFPAGDAARLAYNLITWRLISAVPTAKQMRELFALMAARDRDPQIKLNPDRYLSRQDIQALKEAGSKLSDEEVQIYLQQMSEADIRAMLRLARQGMFDARITTFLNTLTSALKVSGVTDEPGWLRDVFNNPYFSVNGDLNISTMLLAAIGQKGMTSMSGVSLEQLVHGDGPAKAWFQYLVVSVDIRAVINTIVRLTKKTEAKKELEKPFAYSPRLNELAAYEVRVFGFPLLMFYKRGLIKADLEAYEHDYAYGLCGVTLVEHFPTREAMEAEVRAGRMFPLGLVRVPSIKGGWQDTDLVVYAHRIPNGKHRGKTAMVIYGLKAFVEYSELIARELLRFKEYEKGLHEGAVIEQQIWEETSSPAPGMSYEPVVHVGSNAVQQIYNPLFGGLQELRRHWLRKSWGLPVDETEYRQVSQRLAAGGIHPVERNPLVSIDPYGSSFIYVRETGGAEQKIKVTSIPSVPDIDREMKKLEEGKRIEQMRQQAAAGKSVGIVLLNEALVVGGRLELGPLLRDSQDQVVGIGVASGARAMADIFDFINQLPVTDRARLRGNHFAATAVELDCDGKGRKKVFLTIEFPAGEVQNERTNSLTGEQETVCYRNGLWRSSITDHRILELEYDSTGIEIGSRTFANLGDRSTPIRGVVLEETHTLEYWVRDLSQPDLDPYQPNIAKLRASYVTGQFTRETYGLFVLPIEIVDDQYVIQNRFNRYGVFESAKVFENGREVGDSLEPAPSRVLEPVTGRARFQISSQLTDSAERRDLSSTGYQMVLERVDLIKGLVTTETFDNAHGGRKIRENYIDVFDGTRSFSSLVAWEYDQHFHFGLVPVRGTTWDSLTGIRLAEVTTLGYDPVGRRLTGWELNYTGKTRTNTWDYRWANPVEIETGQRSIAQEFNRDETVTRSTTTARTTGEIISQNSGRYDVASKIWQVTNQSWYRPGVPAHTETNAYSAFGKLISSRAGNSLETRPSYSAEGTEQSNQTLLQDTTDGRYDILCRQEDDYAWQHGERRARVRIYVEGSLRDEFRIVTDDEGRTIEDGIRRWPQLELKTVRSYDGDTERLLRAEVIQNGEVRAIHRVLDTFQRPDGGWLLRAQVTPFWGLVSTNSFLLGDPLGRPVETVFENGDRVRVTAWFPGTAIAQNSEWVDRHGQARERRLRQANLGNVGNLPYELVRRFKLSPWGDAAWAEDQAVVPGTEVVLFSDKGEERIYFDLSRLYECPQYAVDPHGNFGLQTRIGGTLRSNVTAVFTCRFREPGERAETNRLAEQVLELATVDLHSLFYHPFSRRTFDRAGQLLEESSGKIRSLGSRLYSEEALFGEMAQAASNRKSIYRYETGWWQAQVDPATGQAMMAFARQPGTNRGNWSVNDAGWREWPTEVRGYKASREGPLAITGTNAYMFQRLHSPRLLRRNRHLPGVTNVWADWSLAELNEAGTTLFESEAIFTAQGELSTRVAHKLTSRGRQGNKIVYHLPRPSPDAWRTVTVSQRTNEPEVNLTGQQDLSACDFVGFYLDAPTNLVTGARFRDGLNHAVLVAGDGTSTERNAISFWPAGSGQVQWLPNENVPERGSVVMAPRSMIDEGKVFVVSIPELVQAGLDVSRLASVDLTMAKPGADRVRVTPLYRLESGERLLVPETSTSYRSDSQSHSSRLDMYRRTKAHLTHQEVVTDRGWQAMLGYEGCIMASLNPRSQPPYYPILLLADNSDPDSPQPLYALAAEEGRFLEYYQTTCAGDTEVYTIVNGFETPKKEVYRSGVLDDEVSPGILAFGHGYYITLPLAKGANGFWTALADLRNRCVASAFALGGDDLARFLLGVGRTPAKGKELTRTADSAAAQAREIKQLPTLAEALLPARRAPWTEVGQTSQVSSTVEIHTNVLKTDFFQLSALYPKTRLIPTSPGTKVERYVDTVQEAALIELAVKCRLMGIAGDLLSFYWEKSQGGAGLLHASYDAETGASLEKQNPFKRPQDAEVTLRARVAIAQAAFCLGIATRDTNALIFGRNLIQGLDEFRPRPNEMAWPRGLKDRLGKPVAKAHGLTLWPRANAFSLASNARAYLLFKRLADQADSYAFEPKWKEMLLEAANEQAAWLTNWIVPCVHATGIVPKGLFEIQDVRSETTAMAVERWTAADDWLTFLEAADQIGISKEITRTWLDNLARIHGVTVSGVWGLDWTIPVQRPDAISTELTARFLRVANLLGHRQAADFARHNLNQLRHGDEWPVAVTTAATNAPLQTGQGRFLYPTQKAPEGRSQIHSLAGWPATLGVYAELADPAWPVSLQLRSELTTDRIPERDLTQFFWMAAGFYLSTVVVALFWWGLSFARRRRRATAASKLTTGLLVPKEVMQRAEERWAKRVLGMCIPAGGERSRYSNGAVEQNFHMQLRAIYKLVIEWRRLVNNWSVNDARLAEDDSDEWLNGLDEFATMVGIYARWVVKAGRKDGLPQADVLQENEDSNHIWSRLVMYFSEWNSRLLELMEDFKANPAAASVLGLNDHIELVVRMMGARARQTPFDARAAFDAPNGTSAFDLLLLQLPGANLTRIAREMERQLDIPSEHFVSFIKGYKSFKERENLFPIHPYVIETAKVLPHFLLMGLVGLIWYNNELGGLRILTYLKEEVMRKALDPHSLIWAVPLFIGVALSAGAHSLQTYRFRWGTRSRSRSAMDLDADFASLFGDATETVMPAMRIGRWWNPLVYQRAGWIFRAIGLGLLAAALFGLEPPSFATFMAVKILVGIMLLTESASLLGPIVISRLSGWLEDYVSGNPKAGGLLRRLNQLNFVPTRPASLVWLSIKYHFQPSVPTGGFGPMLRAITFYLFFGAVFFFVGSYMFKQALEVWFQETYRTGGNLSLVLGTFLFWNTMYLLRFGLFVLFAAMVSAWAIYPLKVTGGLAALACFGLQFVSDSFSHYLDLHVGAAFVVVLIGLVLMTFESELLAWFERWPLWRRRSARREEREQDALEQIRLDPNRALGVVYMSGDDLASHKLTTELLMTRLRILRDHLGSGGMKLLYQTHSLPDDSLLTQWFGSLHALEKKHDVTLWHPSQVVVVGCQPSLREELGLTLLVQTEAERETLLVAWHLRRWLVTMMSTAGHSQDTGINLADIALCLTREGLGANTAFYLIQNKYDNNDNNRPSQLSYDKGELGHRNKLARLLMELAPGSRAYSVTNWTPFGFKAGGLVGMDLVFEESLKLTNMLVLDRNANAHDLEAVMSDVKLALSDPGVVIVLPGRSTTNTLTPIGQSSQLVEEGQRALTRGVMLLGGVGAETLGTGWGNIQAVYYGRVQHSLCDVSTSKMPLTWPTQRDATFGDRCEGLIGFGPHAVGISEDIWGVTQAAHTALALGYQVKCHRSQALWHKIRECWSHAEWLSAFPRWSGGYLQMMLDPMMQRINDFGPLSVFAKEVRASGGRFFLSAPSALLSILLMPLAIIWDVSPFVQILILLWNLGLVMNQVLTALGLVACLESTGFNRVAALGGTCGAAILAGSVGVLTPFALPLTVLGFLAGGFAMGLGRWFYYRGRDVMLFGPQLAIHALGQIVRQSLEFTLSGASANDAKAVNIPFRAWVGPRENRPFEEYQNFVNLRTVVWGVGLVSLLLDLFALTHLDFLNVLLLLPSLMFSVSTLVGPFLMQPKPGKHTGAKSWAPKLLGWIASFTFYMLVARLIASGRWYGGIAALLCAVCFGRVLMVGLKYVGYPRRLRQLAARLARQMVESGLPANEARAVVHEIIYSLGGDAGKAEAALHRTTLAPEHQAGVMKTVEDQLQPFLNEPTADLQTEPSMSQRFVCEWRRSFVLGLFTFIWFFVVPVPGLLVFTVPDGYRISMQLATVIMLATTLVGLVLAGGGVSLFLEWWEKYRLAGKGLMARIEAQSKTFRSMACQPGKLTPVEISHLHAMFTDVQTYFDQRSYAYAWRTLGLIDQSLKTASAQADAARKA